MSVIDMDQWKRTHARRANAPHFVRTPRATSPLDDAIEAMHTGVPDRWRAECMRLTRKQISLQAEIYKLFTSFRPWGD